MANGHADNAAADGRETAGTDGAAERLSGAGSAFDVIDSTGDPDARGDASSGFDALFGQPDAGGDSQPAPKRRGRQRAAAAPAALPDADGPDAKGLGLKLTLARSIRGFSAAMAKQLPKPYGKEIWSWDKDELDLVCGPLATGIKGLTGAGDELPPRVALLIGAGALVLFTATRIVATKQLIAALNAQAQAQMGSPVSYQGRPPESQQGAPSGQPAGSPAPESDDFADLIRGDVAAA